MADTGFYLEGASSILAGLTNTASSLSNVQTSGWDTAKGVVSGLGTVGDVLSNVGGVVRDVNKVTSGQDDSTTPFKMLDSSSVWYSMAQNASSMLTNQSVEQIKLAASNERELHNYNAQMSEAEAQLIERNGLLAQYQQARIDKINKGLRENAANAAGFYVAESPTRALLLHEDAVAEYGRSLMAYQTANQAIAKRQQASMERYKGDMATYIGNRRADATRITAYYKALASYYQLNAQESTRAAEVTAYRGLKSSLPQSGGTWSSGSIKTPDVTSTDVGADEFTTYMNGLPGSNSAGLTMSTEAANNILKYNPLG